jgi:hypothetical protein
VSDETHDAMHGGGDAAAAAVAAPDQTPVAAGARLAAWARLLALDVAVGLMWALLLAAAILFISGLSQFIYVDF